MTAANKRKGVTSQDWLKNNRAELRSRSEPARGAAVGKQGESANMKGVCKGGLARVFLACGV